MSDESAMQPECIDSEVLTPLVRQALGSATVEIISWDAQQIYGGVSFGSAGGSAIHRVSGRGRDQSRTIEWSLILKVLHPPADRGQPSDWDYWRREVDAYASGLLDDLPGGLSAPHCFGVVEHLDETCWIWMEDIADNIGPKWPLEHYGVVARHLGQFNGAYLTERTIPSWPWLSRGWVRDEIVHAEPAITQLRNSVDHPVVRRAFPPDVLDALLHSWAERKRFLDALDRLPQTLCHFDAFRRNLFARHTASGLDETVAIDWAAVGIGPVGYDIFILVASTLDFREVDPGQAKELDRITYEAYLDGLRDAGWSGDPQQVRFGQTAPFTLRAITALAILLPWYLDRAQHARFEQRTGRSIEELADSQAEWRRHHPLAYYEDEARELLDLV